MTSNVIAYIDGANLHKGIATLGWKLDYRRFRSWLRQKYGVNTAKLFIGLLPTHADLYTERQQQGYRCVFKEVVYDRMGKVKGNCDAELVLHAVKDAYEQAPTYVILVSSDGDYSCLIRFWQEKNIACTVLSPSRIQKCSILLKKTGAHIVPLDEVRRKIDRVSKQKRAPDTDVSV